LCIAVALLAEKDVELSSVAGFLVLPKLVGDHLRFSRCGFRRSMDTQITVSVVVSTEKVTLSGFIYPE
jgi:hypothetical protein